MTKKILVGLLVLAVSTPAMAWGEREQGLLAGVAGLLLLQNINRNDAKPADEPRPVYQYSTPIPQSVYPGYTVIQPDYTVCANYWDYRLREQCYRGAEARARQEYQRLSREAYRRGFSAQ